MLSRVGRPLSKAIQRSKPSCSCVPATCHRQVQAKPWQVQSRNSSTGSIFDSNNTWDEILAELDKPEPKHAPSSPRPPVKPPAPRQAITKRETKLLSDMLNRLLDNNPSTAQVDEQQLGLGGGKLDDLFGQLRRHHRTARATNEAKLQELLDIKKEQMSLCENDLQLLEWAQENVFGESVAFEATAKKAMKEAAENGKPSQLPTLQPATYPHMIAALMKAFRERYRDPHLALAIFNHAQNLSIVSYVFGCSTDAYNELLETRWSAFHDMQGVLDTLEEMKVNAVPINNKTRIIVENMRAEINRNKGGTVDPNTWEVFRRIEGTLAAQRQNATWDSWKTEEMDDEASFDDWEFPAPKKTFSSPSSRRSWGP